VCVCVCVCVWCECVWCVCVCLCVCHWECSGAKINLYTYNECIGEVRLRKRGRKNDILRTLVVTANKYLRKDGLCKN